MNEEKLRERLGSLGLPPWFLVCFEAVVCGVSRRDPSLGSHVSTQPARWCGVLFSCRAKHMGPGEQLGTENHTDRVEESGIVEKGCRARRGT